MVSRYVWLFVPCKWAAEWAAAEEGGAEHFRHNLMGHLFAWSATLIDLNSRTKDAADAEAKATPTATETAKCYFVFWRVKFLLFGNYCVIELIEL